MKKKPFGVAINDSETPVRKVKIINGVTKEVWVCRAYKSWNHMLERCYSKSFQSRHSTYIGCTVCEEWLIFSNFRRWYKENIIDGYQLDKDLLVKGNRIYSPEACLFIHQSINKFLIDYNNSKSELLNGVTVRKDSGKFRARCTNPITGKREALGNFNTELEAHLVWAKRKNECAVMIANSDIHMCERTREALLNIDFSQVKTSEG